MPTLQLPLFLRALALATCTVTVAACGATDATEEEGEDDTAEVAADSAYTGSLATLKDTPAPPGMPKSWAQPDSEGIFSQYGYCGATAAANLLGFYGKNVSPQQAIDGGCWSHIGTTASRLGKYMKAYPELGCWNGRMAYDADALGNLRTALAGGRPVIVQFMTGKVEAHWVTIVGVRGEGDHPEVVMMTWGKYKTAKWDDFKDAWRRGWGGYYPYVMCQAASPMKSALFVK
jgi:hypothetical protein